MIPCGGCVFALLQASRGVPGPPCLPSNVELSCGVRRLGREGDFSQSSSAKFRISGGISLSPHAPARRVNGLYLRVFSNTKTADMDNVNGNMYRVS